MQGRDQTELADWLGHDVKLSYMPISLIVEIPDNGFGGRTW